MMQYAYKAIPAFAVIAVLVLGAVAFPTRAAESAEEQEVKVTLDQLPTTVKAAVEKECQEAWIKEIEKENEDGQITYEVEFVKDGEKIETKFAADGSVIERETDDEDDEEDEDVELTLEQVPPPVRAAIERENQDAEITGIERENEDGHVVYAVDLIKGKEKSEIKVSRKGKMLEREIVIDISQVPDAVRETLRKEAEGGRIGKEIEKALRPGKAVYSAEVEVGGKEWEVEVGEDGSVLRRETEDDEDDDDHEAEEEDDEEEVEVTVEELPAAVKTTLERESENGKVLRIERETEHGRVIYSAIVKTGEDKVEVEINTSGKVVERETAEDENEGEGEREHDHEE